MIRLENLSKEFKGVRVVDGLSLHVKKGEIFGLLGPNAAGKTTAIRMLCNLLELSDGKAYISGIDIASNSKKLKFAIGYVAQDFGLYEKLSVYENLEFYANLYEDVKEDDLLALLEKYKLLEFSSKAAGSLSGGYKRRLSLCCALSHNPEVLFLDEPTAGIDPASRKELWDVFYDLAQEGKTLFVTTHYMEEAQRCNTIAFLNHGKKVIEGSPYEVTNSLEEYTIYKTKETFEHTLLKHLQADKNVYLVNLFGDELRVMVYKTFAKESLELLMHPFMKEQCELELAEANLEDVFIALTKDEVS